KAVLKEHKYPNYPSIQHNLTMPSCFCQYFICFFIANYCLPAETSAVFCQFSHQRLKTLYFTLKPVPPESIHINLI
ncbi:MAG: hypothetical protein PUG65_03840, partial [Firmicutes bacterium]|nr:hypothetical protein [Bacillota bacterium]